MLHALATFVAIAIAIILFVAVLGSRAEKGPGLHKDFPWQFRLAAKCRTPLLMFVVIPLSFLQRKYVRTRLWLRLIVRKPGGKRAAVRHAANVEAIEAQIREWNEAGRPCMLRSAKPNWKSMSLKLGSNKTQCHLIKLGTLDEIIEIDEAGLTVTCEPNVTMGQLTAVLLPKGLALQTHVEMEAVTIGGMAMGFGIETNSHKFGFFQESVLEYELLNSHGDRHVITAASDPDLFYAMPWSHGTLGFLTCIKARLVRVKPYILLVYEPTATPAELTKRLAELGRRSGPEPAPDFVEATLFDKNRAVIQRGYYVDTPPDGVHYNRINDFWKPFFFRHVEGFVDAAAPTQEVMPLEHFLHRFTRSIFWELEDMIPFANHPVYRCLWGWLGAPEVSLLKLFQGPVIRRASAYAHVVQESIMPMRHLEEGIAKFDDWFGAYPLLVFPVRIFNRGRLSGFLTPRAEECDGDDPSSGLWVDLGAYGVPKVVKAGEVWDAKTAVRAMEHWTRDVGGFQALYTDIFCTPTELREMFNFDLLDAARARLKCHDAFPHIYDKVRSEKGIYDDKLEAMIAACDRSLDNGKPASATFAPSSERPARRKNSGAVPPQ